MRLKFIKTCDFCPEQYDIVDKKTGNLVAYVRLRSGILVVRPYLCDGQHIDFNTELFKVIFNDCLLGWFHNRIERFIFLLKIRYIVYKYLIRNERGL